MVTEEEKEFREAGIFKKILIIFGRFLFGILCSLIIIVMAVPALMYVIFCMLTGRQARFRVRNLDKYLN